MKYEEDLDLEGRLRRISANPEPEVPASLYRFADQIKEGTSMDDKTETQNVPIPIGLARGRRARRRSPVRILAGLAAALVVAVAAGTLLLAVVKGGPAATKSYGPDDWTGLQWHDITATSDGLFIQEASRSGQQAFASVVAFNGSYYATGFGVVDGQTNDAVWTSHDGLVWTRVPGAPSVLWLGVLNGQLVGQGAPAEAAPWTSWTSADGVTWESHVQSFAGPNTGMGGWVTTSTAALVDTADMSGEMLPASPAATATPGNGAVAPALASRKSDFYVTTDGISWRKGTLPTDMPGNQGAQFFSGGDVFVMEATIDDAASHGYGQDAQGKPIAQADHLWTSRDGQNWTRLDTAAAGEFLGAIYTGSLGLSIPPIGRDGFHSTDGSNWTKDADRIPIINNTNMGSSMTMSEQSDGLHILVSADWNEQFSVSRGDGHWRTLQQGGDIGSLPGGGQAFLLPHGVLYVGGGRLFYGEALAGPQTSGDLHPAATITEAPTPTPPGYTPRPVPSAAPAVSWTGISGVRKLAGGPAGATSITRWEGGYVAVRNAATDAGTFTAWSSPDGVTWTKIPDGTFGQHPTAEVAQDADKVVLATWGGTVQVWSSTDGLNWQQAAISGPPIGGRPMAGNSQGVVALMDDPQYTLYSDMGNSVILNTGINSLHSVAVSNGRWVIVGQVNGDSPTPTGPAAWWSNDGVAWTAASVDEAPNDGFRSVVAGRDGFVAIGFSGGATVGSNSFWTSADGKAWHPESAMGPFPGAASFAGDGNRIVGWGRGASGQTEFWTSQDGKSWTQLTLSGDTAALLAAKSAYVFPVGNGVLFTTADGAWYGVATVQK